MSVPRVDAHHHLWRYDPAQFGWIEDHMTPLRRDFLPEDMQSELGSANIGATIVVQARSSLEESRFLLRCASQSAVITGVVGWVPLTHADELTAALDELCTFPAFVGVREITQGMAAGSLEKPSFSNGIARLCERDLAYDLLVFPDQLTEAARLIDRHPRQRFVLDHCAKPKISSGELEPWARNLRELAQRPNIVCKVSGLVTEARWTTWTDADLRPYIDVVVEAFGPSRLLAASDWPVCLLATSYAQWWSTLTTYFASFSSSERQHIFGGAAVETYRLQKLLSSTAAKDGST